MSLKGFHIFFIFLATLLCVGCAWWAFANEVGMAFGGSSAAVAVALFVYGIFFVKKTRRLIL